MPTSNHEQISKIITIICRLKPKNLLDIGIGFGKYGMLSREYLENGEPDRCKWMHRIDGIEAFKKNVNPIYKYFYDNILWGDAKDIVETIDVNYNLSLLIDVLEHFDFDEGHSLVMSLQTKSANILISTPKLMPVQGALFGNPYEVHKTQWHKEDLKKFGNCIFFSDTHQYICLVGPDAERLRHLNLKMRVGDCFPFLRSWYRRRVLK